MLKAQSTISATNLESHARIRVHLWLNLVIISLNLLYLVSTFVRAEFFFALDEHKHFNIQESELVNYYCSIHWLSCTNHKWVGVWRDEDQIKEEKKVDKTCRKVNESYEIWWIQFVLSFVIIELRITMKF